MCCDVTTVRWSGGIEDLTVRLLIQRSEPLTAFLCAGDNAAQNGAATSQSRGEAGGCWSRVQRSTVYCQARNCCLQGLLRVFFVCLFATTLWLVLGILYTEEYYSN